MLSHAAIDSYAESTETMFECESCKENVKFYIRDFDKHAGSQYTNLRAEDFVGASDGYEFLDFYCPGCDTPITIIYRIEVGGGHGQYRYCIEGVEQPNAQ